MTEETADQIKHRTWAQYFFGACDDGSVRPEDASWNLEKVPIALLAPLFDGGTKATLDAEIESWIEEYGTQPHWLAFLQADDFNRVLANNSDFPVIISIDTNENIQVWDGWHRIACAVVRNEPAITILVGRAFNLPNKPKF